MPQQRNSVAVTGAAGNAALINLDDEVIAEVTRIVFGEVCPPRPCDLIFVFGGSHPGLWETAAQAYALGLGKEVLVTGGWKPTAIRHHSWQHGQTPEAEIISQELLERGVPPERIYAEMGSTNSYENVIFAQAIYDFSRINSLLAICKSYGVGRQVRTLQAQLPTSIEILPYPFDTNMGVDGPIITRDNWMTMAHSREGVLDHAFKIIKYSRKGHVKPLPYISDKLRTAICQAKGVSAAEFFKDSCLNGSQK